MRSTGLQEEYDQVNRIAHGDNLDTFAAIMPYLLLRREVARDYVDRPRPAAYEHLQSINKEIAKILSIF